MSIPRTTYDAAGHVLSVDQIVLNPLEINGQTLRDRATQALTANATFLSAAKPSTAAAQASQAYDQTVRLTRECSALIRLFLGALDDITGT